MKRTLKDRQIRHALRDVAEEQNVELRKVMRNEGRKGVKFHDLESIASSKRKERKLHEWEEHNDLDDLQDVL